MEVQQTFFVVIRQTFGVAAARFAVLEGNGRVGLGVLRFGVDVQKIGLTTPARRLASAALVRTTLCLNRSCLVLGGCIRLRRCRRRKAGCLLEEDEVRQPRNGHRCLGEICSLLLRSDALSGRPLFVKPPPVYLRPSYCGWLGLSLTSSNVDFVDAPQPC